MRGHSKGHGAAFTTKTLATNGQLIIDETLNRNLNTGQPHSSSFYTYSDFSNPLLLIYILGPTFFVSIPPFVDFADRRRKTLFLRQFP